MCVDFMLRLTTDLKATISKHALKWPNQEVCGLIVQRPGESPKAVPCRNDHPQYKTDFAISSHHHIAAYYSGCEVLGCYHSHVNDNPHFSLNDIKQARFKGDWWVLYHLPTNRFTSYQKDIHAPYVGREWIWTYQNCFTLFQDFYQTEFDHKIDDFYLSNPRSFLRQDVGYIDNLPSQGLKQIPLNSELQRGDLLITYNGCRYPNHCMIVTDPKRSRAIHHSMGELSCEINYDGVLDIHSVWRLG
jgi:proteasome lid subunit RPN8/RPN11